MFDKIFYHYHCSHGTAYCCRNTVYNKLYLDRNGKKLLTIPQIDDNISGFGIVKSIDIFIGLSLIIRIK